MTNKNTANMIQACIEEISGLRARVAELQPRAEAYQAITQILGLLPQRSQGMGIDILWQLRKELEELQPKVPVEEPEV